MSNSFQKRMMAAAKSAVVASAAITLTTSAAVADDAELTIEEVASIREFRLTKDYYYTVPKVPDGSNIHWEAKPDNE